MLNDTRLSTSQQSLWFMHQLHPDSAMYNLPVGLDLCGEVDHEAVRTALRALVARHEGLRTRFPDTGGTPRYEVVADFAPALPVIDLTGAADPGAELARLSLAQVTAPFDLTADVPLRALLVRTPDRTRLLLTIHHILVDGWSMQTVVDELAALYGQVRTGRPATLGPVPLQYPDFARWQHELLAGPRGDELVAYWRDRLRDLPPPLPLPTDRPVPRRRTFTGDEVEAEIPPDLAGRIAHLARSCGGTQYMVHLAAFALRLGRWCGVDDLVVGMPMACRTEAAHAELVGCTVNIVPLRVDLAAAADFPALVAQVRDLVLDAFTHQQLPLEHMVRLFAGRRERGTTPLFRVVCNQMGPMPAPVFAGTTSCRVVRHFATTGAKYDLVLHVTDDAGGVLASVEYATELFDRPTARRVLDRHLATLTGITGDRTSPHAVSHSPETIR